MTRLQRLLALTLMAFSLAHAVVGFYLPIPAWKMFRTVPRWTYSLEDCHGLPIDLHDYIQHRGYTINVPRSVGEIGMWIIEHEPDRAPLRGSITHMYPKRSVRIDFEVFRNEMGVSRIRKLHKPVILLAEKSTEYKRNSNRLTAQK